MYRQNQTAAAQRDVHNVRAPRPPERPLAPYNRFSRKMWPKIRQENPDSPIWDIGRTISQLWRDASESEKYAYQQEFEVERVEYEKALKAYHNSAAYQQYLIARTRVLKPNEKNVGSRKGVSSETNNVTGVIIQPCDDEDPYEMTGKRLSAFRFDRNNRLMSELFAPNYLPDSRTMIPQQRIETLRKQGQSLSLHQTKLNDELKRLDETFNQRKKTVEMHSDTFEEQLKKVCEDRPQLCEERYNSLVNEWQGVLLKSYEDYKKRQAAIRARLEAERRETPVLYSLTCEKSPSPDSASRKREEQQVKDAKTEQQSNGVLAAKAEESMEVETHENSNAKETEASNVEADKQSVSDTANQNIENLPQ